MNRLSGTKRVRRPNNNMLPNLPTRPIKRSKETRRISYANTPPNVRVFYPPGAGITPGTMDNNQANLNEPIYPMYPTYVSSTPLREKIANALRKSNPAVSNKEINETYNQYKEIKAAERKINKSGNAVVHGVLMKHLAGVNVNNNIARENIRKIPAEFGRLPHEEKERIFTAIGTEIKKLFEGKEPKLATHARLDKLLGDFSPFLRDDFVIEVSNWLSAYKSDIERQDIGHVQVGFDKLPREERDKRFIEIFDTIKTTYEGKESALNTYIRLDNLLQEFSPYISDSVLISCINLLSTYAPKTQRVKRKYTRKNNSKL